MSLVTMSVYGLYQYNENLFDELALPDGIERETVINNILLDSMELETYITDPDALKTSIGYWSRAQLPIWQHLKETTEYVYNPIWNKDGTVTETETRDLAGSKTNTQTRNLAGTSGSTETRNLSGTSGDTETRNLAGTSGDTETRNLAGSGDTTTENGVNAFNGTGYADRDQSITNASTTDTGTVQHSGSTTDTGTVQHSGSTSDTGTVQHSGSTSDTGTVKDTGQSTNTGTITRSKIEKGNIGVTTTQQMIKEEREIAEFNLVNYIVRSFIERFCLLVY